MRQLKLTPIHPEGPDAAAAEGLRRALEREVGAVERPSAPRPPGAKGSLLVDGAAFVVAVLSSQAVAQLIGVIRAYLEKERGSEIEVEGPGGKVRLKVSDARKLGGAEWDSIVNRILGGG